MAGERERYHRGQPCCEGRAPVRDYVYEGGVGGIGGPLSDDEKAAISAGGTFTVTFLRTGQVRSAFKKATEERLA